MEGAEKLAKPSGWRKGNRHYYACKLWVHHGLPTHLVAMRKRDGRWQYACSSRSIVFEARFEEIPDVKTFVEAIQVVSVILRMM